jgi:flagellar biosynthesis/type III secretory pathway M-ring protein FliF/YscJ
MLIMEPLVIVVLVIIVVAILLWLAPKNYVGYSAGFAVSDNNRRLARPGGAAIKSCCGGK